MIRNNLGVIKRKVVAYFKYRNNKLIFFHFPSSKDSNVLRLDNDITFHTINSNTEYESLCKKFSIPINKNYKRRFESNAVFAVLVNKVDYVSYGWLVTNLIGFPIDEINVAINIPTDTYVLFDFFTNTTYRNRKYYQLLLNNIINSLKLFELVIYVLVDNLPSEKAITKSGFESIGISKFNSIDFVRFLNERNVKIEHSKIKSRI